MKTYIIKVIFRDGTYGYYKDTKTITSDITQARFFSYCYGRGFCDGINFGIRFYEDIDTKEAILVEY